MYKYFKHVKRATALLMSVALSFSCLLPASSEGEIDSETVQVEASQLYSLPEETAPAESAAAEDVTESDETEEAPEETAEAAEAAEETVPVESAAAEETAAPAETDVSAEEITPVETIDIAEAARESSSYLPDDIVDASEEQVTASGGDYSADVENSSVWESTIRNVKLIGSWEDDVLAIAESQLGYAESTRNFVLCDDGEMYGYSRYGAKYGMPYGNWCAMFASFCIEYAGIPTTPSTAATRSDGSKVYVPIEANCQRWVNALSAADVNLYRSATTVDAYGNTSLYIPKPGDLVFFDWTQDGISDHVGFVYELVYDQNHNLTEILTLEGNTADVVAYRAYEWGTDYIMGYGEMPENPQGIFTLNATTAGGVTVTVAGNLAAIHCTADEITLKVAPDESALLQGLLEKYQNNAGIMNFQLLQISLWRGDQEITPEHTLYITFDGAFVNKGKSILLYQISENAGTAASIQKMETFVNDNGSVTVETAGSAFAAVSNYLMVITDKHKLVVLKGRQSRSEQVSVLGGNSGTDLSSIVEPFYSEMCSSIVS